MTHTSIRVGQRLISWDGTRGYVAHNSTGKRTYGPEELFLVRWQDEDGSTDGPQYYTLETLQDEGITLGRGIMSWAR